MNDNMKDSFLPKDDIPEDYREPVVVTWNRLEPRPRSKNFDRSLRAEIRDALWMLTRQWQFGEFKGEDAGSAILAKLQIETTKITKSSQKGSNFEEYDETLPLETKVEREKVPIDFLSSLQMGQHWFHLLREHNLYNEYASIYVNKYAITIDPTQDFENRELFSNQELWQLRAAAVGRGINGGDLYLDIINGKSLKNEIASDDRSINEADKGTIVEAEKEFVEYYGRLFNQPNNSGDSAWDNSHLEYQFACSAPRSDGTEIILVADEYYQGHLDWYSFDIDSNNKSQRFVEKVKVDNSTCKEEIITFIPTEAHFAGMPHSRWWEFEDQKCDFGKFDAHTTDTAKLLLIEMGLIHGKDWLLLPYEVAVGSLCEIKNLIVKDVFGQRTLIKTAGHGDTDNWQKWSMFKMNARGTTKNVESFLFIPPTLVESMESEPIEKVTILRDEMANLVWAVESRVPNGLGGGMDGKKAATDMENYLRKILQSSLAKSQRVGETSATIKYRLSTSVPENWIPFVPKHISNSNREIQLQRSKMYRKIEGLGDNYGDVTPRGIILTAQPGEFDEPFLIYEEEIPRAGAKITRTFQRTRWHNGQTYLWIGRRKQTGRGEGSSGLKFDQIIPISDEDSSRQR